jgi:class 3 adenylate cyclase/tetratricopeptide (TPR) repeat protein
MSNKITAWLEALGLVEYDKLFATQRIDYEVLPELTDADLKDLGIPLGPRKKLLKAISTLTPDTASPVNHEATAVSTPDAERRQLTVMFCDLVGSTELSQILDPEDMREVNRAYQDACKNAIERFEGYVARYMGDGVLAYFGYPMAHEDDAQRSLLAGLEVIDAMRAVNSKVGNIASTVLRVRVGIATGPVIVGDIIGDGASMESAVVGETPNLAARLQGIAGEDTVIVSAATYELTRRQFQFEDLGAQHLKGFDDAVQCWCVQHERTGGSRFEASAGENLTPFVGRSEELEVLKRRLHIARSGEGQVILVSGEAGIGKSRLAQSLHEHIDDDDLFLSYQCSPVHSSSAFYPVIANIERNAHINLGDSPETKLEKLKGLAADSGFDKTEDMQILSALLNLSIDTRISDIEPDPEKRKARIFELLIQQLEFHATRKTIVYLFEDVHWIDPSTLDLLGRFVDKIRDLPALLIVTSRPGFTAPWTDLAHVQVETLNRIPARQASEMIGRLAGDKELPEEIIAQIIDHTDGIPLFVEELTRTVLDSGFLDEHGHQFVLNNSLSQISIPTTLQDSLNARLDNLSDVKFIAQAAAVIGRNFDYGILAAAASLDAEQLDSALKKLELAGLIHALGTAPSTTYTFKHALVRDTAYQSLLSTNRKQLHQRIASVVEQEFPELASSEPEVLAYHFGEAGLAKPAIEYWTRAAERSIEASAHLEGIASLENALTLIEQLPDDNKKIETEIALQLSLGVAEVQGIGPGSDEAFRTYTRAHELTQIDATPRQRFDALWGVHFVNMIRGDLKYSRDIGVELIPLAKALCDDVMILESHHAQWSTMCGLGELEKAIEHTDFVLPRYDAKQHHRLTFSHGGHDPGVCAHGIGGVAHWLIGDPVKGRSIIADGLKLAERLSHPYTLVEAYMCAGYLDIAEGQVEDPKNRAAKLHTLVGEGKLPLALADYMESTYGAALIVAGNAEAGLEIMDRTVYSLDDWGVWGFPQITTYALALSDSDRTEEALSHIDGALDSDSGGQANWWLAEFHRIRGEILIKLSIQNELEAQGCFEQALKIAKSQKNRILELRASMNIANSLNLAGETKKARDILAPVYKRFTEGHDTIDLLNARKLLESLQ